MLIPKAGLSLRFMDNNKPQLEASTMTGLALLQRRMAQRFDCRFPGLHGL